MNFEQWQKKRKQKATESTSSCDSQTETTPTKSDRKTEKQKEKKNKLNDPDNTEQREAMSSNSMELQAQILQISSKLDNMVTTAVIDAKLSPVLELINSTKQELKSQIEVWKSEFTTSFNETLEELKGQVHDLQVENKSLKEKVEKLEEKQKKQTEKAEENAYAAKLANLKCNDLEQYTRKDSIRIRGVEDTKKNETHIETAEKALRVLKDKLGMNITEKDISVAHRLGTFSSDPSATRSMIVKFVARHHRIEAIQKRRTLKGSGIVIQEDLTKMNMKLLEKVSRLDSVDNAWTQDGNIVAKLITGRIMRVTHNTDLQTLLHHADSA